MEVDKLLQIKHPRDNKQERQYILKLLFEQFLGVDVTLEEHHYPQYEIILPNSKRIVFLDAFFSQYKEDLAYLKQSAIPGIVEFISNQFTNGLSLPVIYGNDLLDVNDDSITCGIDIFAGAFFMLTRWEEYVCKVHDKHDRFPASASIAYKNNFLMRPVVNEYVEML